MKQINNYISEKLYIDKKYKAYKYSPNDKEELKSLLKKLLEERGLDADLNDIDVSKITDMSSLFFSSGLSQIKNIDISKWDVSNVTNMNEMFNSCKEFNCDLSNWDVSKVEYMSDMFCYCRSFKCDISKWNVSNVKRWSGFAHSSPIENSENMPKFGK